MRKDGAEQPDCHAQRRVMCGVTFRVAGLEASPGWAIAVSTIGPSASSPGKLAIAAQTVSGLAADVVAVCDISTDGRFAGEAAVSSR